MAYVVARPRGRWEIRESVHTPAGPRARSLAGFKALTDEVIVAARERATRPFDVDAIVASARRAGAPLSRARDAGGGSSEEGAAGKIASKAGFGSAGGVGVGDDSAGRFVQASRAMARSLRPRPGVRPRNPGTSLIELLGFADAVTAGRPAGPREALEFPVLGRLVEDRGRT